MKKVTGFIGMSLLTFVFVFGSTGCFTPPPIVSAGEALDAIGTSRVTELQYYTGTGIVLTLMRTKNDQLDSAAVIKKGQPTYTRETISIPFGTKGLVVQRSVREDGRLVLGVAFEEDESKLLWFVQNTTEIAPFTHFTLVVDDIVPDLTSARDDPKGAPVIKYGDAYYWVQWGSGAILGVIEKNVKVRLQSAKGRKI